MKKTIIEKDYVITLQTKMLPNTILIESSIVHKDFEKIKDKIPPVLEGTYVLEGEIIKSNILDLEMNISKIFNNAILKVIRLDEMIIESNRILTKLGFE